MALLTRYHFGSELQSPALRLSSHEYSIVQKRVWIDGNELVFAAYGKTYTVAVNEIVHIGETPVFRPHRVRLTFGVVTRFGNSIAFFPPLQIRHWSGEHP